ncbi:MAG: quinate 5-dehydrogenase [Armatimonadetes bacterium]|nr:quinate 5-dehydrogenase [Armatimonadota bacterium]
MKRITSISLGSSARDKAATARFLGEDFAIERIGTDGDMALFRKKLMELDGQVDAFGLGGTDMYIWAAGRRYTFREIERLASAAKKTPVVDGSGLKNTLERETVHRLQREGTVDFAHSKVLLVSAVDRFGMAEALAETGASVVYGDFMFGLGLPIALRSMPALQRAARLLLPVIVRLPFKWLYPTGEKQNVIVPKWEKFYAEADIIAGDFPFIRRHMPDALPGKTILTNTTRPVDIEELKKRGVARLITTTPEIEGGSFGTNVMEGVLVALSGRKPDQLTADDYMGLLEKLNWQPRVQALS